MSSRRTGVNAKRIQKIENRIQTEMKLIGAATTRELMHIAADQYRATESRVRACFLLGQIKDRAAAKALLRLGHTEHNDRVAWAAFSAIGLIGSPEVTDSLLGLLRSSTNRRKKQMVVYALWLLGDIRSRAVLIRTLADVTEDEKTRGFAAEGLGDLRPTAQTLEALVAALNEPSVFLRMSALCALGNAGEVIHARDVAVKPEARHVFRRKVLPAIQQRLTDTANIKGERTIASRAQSILARWTFKRTELSRSSTKRDAKRRVL